MSAPTSSNVICRTWTGQPAVWQGLACHQTPDDLMNFAAQVWSCAPRDVVEVGTGDGGTTAFLRSVALHVHAVDVGSAPVWVSDAFVILDGDVYSHAAMLADLATYDSMAQWLVVCHTNRPDWGSASAVDEWRLSHRNWAEMGVPHPTQHTWLVRR